VGDKELYAYRRHLKPCEFFGPGGRDVRLDRCKCPLHADGLHRGQRVRKSLRTRSAQIAERRLANLRTTLDARLAERTAPTEEEAAPFQERTVSETTERFLLSHGCVDLSKVFRGDVEYSTYRKYRCSLRLLTTFCERQGATALSEVTIDVLDDYRRNRRISQVTWKVELQTLRTFFAYCISHKWLTSNPARELKAPRNLKPNEVVPYSLQEESLILAACEQIGGGKYHRSGASYEQFRARAMIMLLRHTALRVSDVATLRKDALSFDEDRSTWLVLVRTQKSGEAVYLPIPAELKLLLDALPLPRNAAQDCPYYFWNGQTLRRAAVGIAERTLGAVFAKSGVKNAHAHRYRHTLATSLLAEGASFQTVADILGNTAEIVRKHYGKWSKGRQENIDRLMMAHFQRAGATNPVTKMSHEKMGAIN
jgi:site-specific recombinase XerD